MVTRCKKPFEPEVFKSGTNYLVVDGFIDVSAGGITRFILSRTANVSDSAFNSPELHATMQVESNSGDTYPLAEPGTDGVYTSAALNLDKTKQYRVSVKTANGNLYRSDFVIPHPTPAIDSLNWVQNNGVTVYVNTHDATNNTRYYRWTYAGTWQYESIVYSEWGVANNLIYHRDSASQQIHVCWKTTNSTDILLGTSGALSQDVISQAPLTKLPQDDGKLDIRYSILVNQYALTAEAYAYWQIIQKNTQQLGSLFDEQPSLLVGNVHSISNPNEPVIGFVTAASAQQARMFIDHHDLQGVWKSVPHDYGCQLLFTSQNPTNFLIFDYPNKSYVPVYFQSGGGLAIAKDSCVDCTLQGGINHKPAFW
jgi:hypothetical protein